MTSPGLRKCCRASTTDDKDTCKYAARFDSMDRPVIILSRAAHKVDRVHDPFMPSSRSLLSILLLGVALALTVPYISRYFHFNTALSDDPKQTPVRSAVSVNMTRTPVYFLSHGKSMLSNDIV